MILVLLMNALAAFIFVASKPLLTSIDPLVMVSIRLLGSALIILLYYLFWQIPSSRISRSYFTALLIIGICNGYAMNLFQLLGLSYISAVHASLWANCTPFVVALINYIVYKSRPSYTKLTALLIGWFGFVPLLWGIPSQSLIHYLYGAGFFIAGAVMTALSSIIMEKNKSIAHYPMTLTNGFVMAIGGMIACIHYLLFAPKTFSFMILSGSQLSLLALLIPVTLLSAVFYFYFIKKFGSLLVTFAGFSLPIFSIIFEYLWKGTVQITPQFLLSSALITFALFLFTRE